MVLLSGPGAGNAVAEESTGVVVLSAVVSCVAQALSNTVKASIKKLEAIIFLFTEFVFEIKIRQSEMARIVSETNLWVLHSSTSVERCQRQCCPHIFYCPAQKENGKKNATRDAKTGEV